MIPKLAAYELTEKHGLDTYESANRLGLSDDARNYLMAADMLIALNVKVIKLLTNSPDKFK